MSGLDKAVTECSGVEASNGTETYDLGKENWKLKNQLDVAANNLTKKNSGVLSYLKMWANGDALKLAAGNSVSRQIDGVSKQWRFDACVNAGRAIEGAINAAKNPKAANAYIEEVSRQAPQVAGIKQGWTPQVAMNDSFQDGLDALKKGSRQAKLDKLEQINQ